MDAAGRRLAKARLPEGIAGITRLHAMIGQWLGDDVDGTEGAATTRVKIGIETDRGPWVQALIAAGYTVFAVNPLQAARYRERLAVSGAKSDAADAHMLADMVRNDAHPRRSVEPSNAPGVATSRAGPRRSGPRSAASTWLGRGASPWPTPRPCVLSSHSWAPCRNRSRS